MAVWLGCHRRGREAAACGWSPRGVSRAGSGSLVHAGATVPGVLFLWAALAGCAGPPPPPRKPSVSQSALEAQYYEEVYLLRPGGPEAHDHLGYTGLAYQDHAGQRSTRTIVYDQGFTPVGFFLDNGATYVFEGDRPVLIGNHSTERSLQLILKVDGQFRFLPLRSARDDRTGTGGKAT